MLRACLALLLTGGAPALQAEPRDSQSQASTLPEQHFAELAKSDGPLDSARSSLFDCQAGCITPSEAARIAFEAGEGQARKGRFLLDVRGGGQSLSGELGQLFFVSSRQDYARFGTLTIAIDPDALYDLLRRAKVCGADRFRPGEITVKGCRQDVNFDVNMFTMMQRLSGRRIVVDGEARLRWIDAQTGLPRPVANKRGDNELGYYQVWVKVDNADQVIFVYDDQ